MGLSPRRVLSVDRFGTKELDVLLSSANMKFIINIEISVSMHKLLHGYPCITRGSKQKKNFGTIIILGFAFDIERACACGLYGWQ